MRKGKFEKDQSLISFKKLLIQFIVIYILIIGIYFTSTLWMGSLNNNVYEAENKVITLLNNREEVSETEILVAKRALEESAISYERSQKIINYGLSGLTVFLSIYLMLISIFSYRKFRENSLALEASVKEAEDDNRFKTMFLANIIHEIRTPLNAIIGFSEVLSKDLIASKNGTYAEVIHSSANQLLPIVNDILDISKIESGNIALENRSFDIKELMHQIYELYKIRAEDQDIDMVFIFDRQTPRMVRGDSLRLQQVIANLLSNAIKFTPEGGTVTMNMTLLDDDQEQVNMKFSVEDTGIGIPEEAHERIFEAFSQADGGVSRNFGGTGLGLAISQKILDMMQSKLELESHRRQGSKFFFEVMMEKDLRSAQEDEPLNIIRKIGVYPQYIALLRVHQHLLEIIGRSGEVEIINNIKGDIDFNLICLFRRERVMEDYHTIKLFYPNVPILYIGDKRQLDTADISRFDGFINVNEPGMEISGTIEALLSYDQVEMNVNRHYDGRILIFEADDSIKLLLEVLLEKVGLLVDIVDSGQEAISFINAYAYDMIFIDIDMAENEGVKVAEQIMTIAKEENRAYVPIIAITADALKDNRDQYIQLGMDDYIPKPLSENNLDSILRKYMSEQLDVPKGNTARKKVVVPQKLPKKKSFAPYDPEAAAEKVGVDRSTMDMLLDNFFIEFDSEFVRLKSAVNSWDNIKTAKIITTLKDITMNLFFEKGLTLLQEVDDLLKKNRIEDIHLEVIEEYFNDLRSELKIK